MHHLRKVHQKMACGRLPVLMDIHCLTKNPLPLDLLFPSYIIYIVWISFFIIIYYFLQNHHQPHCRLSPQTSISNPCDPGDPGQVVRNPPVGHFLIPVNFGDPGKIYWNMQSRNWNVQFNPCAVLPRRIECFGIKMFYFCDFGQWSWSAAIPVILVTSQ